VAMKLKKFNTCNNHRILYQGKCEILQSCPHYGASRYKRNAGCRTDVDDEGRKTRQKKKKTTKQILFPEDEDEEGYM